MVFPDCIGCSYHDAAMLQNTSNVATDRPTKMLSTKGAVNFSLFDAMLNSVTSKALVVMHIFDSACTYLQIKSDKKFNISRKISTYITFP